MPINSRKKGQVGEREVIHILREELGLDASRNLDQWRDGGSDVLGLNGWSIEVKRAKAPLLKQWWEQTCRQTGDHEFPCLWYRLDRRDWRVVVPLYAVNDEFRGQPSDLEWTAELSPAAFCMLVRESLTT
jgi:Holliday junction resolvase